MSRSNRQNGNNNSDRAARASRGIAGPTSALTDYLAANNISAAEIARNHQRRQQAALTQAVAAESSASTPSRSSRDASGPQSAAAGSSQSQASNLPRRLTNPSSVAALADKANVSALLKKKPTRAEAKAIEHYKTTDEFRQAKGHYRGDIDDDDTLARVFYYAAQKAVGQFENCALCGKRFTVTNYTVAGPDGGLVCTSCAKDLDAAEGGSKKKKQLKVSGGQVGKRRKIQSRILDGTAPIGVKSLVNLCIEHLSGNIHLAEDLGQLPEHVIDRIARILAKRRQLTSKTLSLFLQPGTRTLKIYDAASLSSQDMMVIFQRLHDLTSLKIRHGIQFKDEVVEFLLARPIELEALSLKGCNLITSNVWEKYFSQKGQHLRTFQVYCSGGYFIDQSIEQLVQFCPKITRLKLVDNLNVTANAIESIKKLSQLEHLSLRLREPVPNPAYVSLLDNVGSKLETLSLDRVEGLNDTVLQAIQRNCRSLTKLRITGSEQLTDDAFARLFTDWVNPRLRYVDLRRCRLSEAKRDTTNEEGIGLCDQGFIALMEHSGSKVQHLNIESCRHISAEAFMQVFSADKTYPDLETLEVSFCFNVNDFIVGCIFRSCPAIKWVKVFGCMKVKNVPVPRGKTLIGVPNAIGMQIEGYH